MSDLLRKIRWIAAHAYMNADAANYDNSWDKRVAMSCCEDYLLIIKATNTGLPDKIEEPLWILEVGVIEDALWEALDEYVVAKKAFDECPDMVKSTPIPPESEEISKRFFACRDKLRTLCRQSDSLVARNYAFAAIAAEDCPKLVLANKTDEAAKRMERLSKSEQELLSCMKWRSDVVSDS